MPLLGSAAMLLSFDVLPEAVAEHDDWHTHEHLPERLSIPGFLRGTRWTCVGEGPRYCVLYEVAALSVLTSGAYLERLNRPTPWTSKMMPMYRGMTRGLCEVVQSCGHGLGGLALLTRFAADGEADAGALAGLLRGLPDAPGVGSAHLFRQGAAAPMTREQRLRGPDAGMGAALLLTGYREEALRRAGKDAAAAAKAPVASAALYRQDYALTAEELRLGLSP